MDKVISARLDEGVVALVDSLARKLRISKKKVLEDAVLNYADSKKHERHSVIRETSGAWNRDEPPAETVKKVKATFRKSMMRYAR